MPESGGQLILGTRWNHGRARGCSELPYSRRKPRGWYDLAFVLLHNEHGGAVPAAEAVLGRFPSDLVGSVRTALDDLLANFSSASDQDPVAYAGQMQLDHPELDLPTLAAGELPQILGARLSTTMARSAAIRSPSTPPPMEGSRARFRRLVRR